MTAPGPVLYRPSIREFDTITEQAARSMADRALHHAKAVGRPFLDADGLVAARLGEPVPFLNPVIVVAAPDDWDEVIAQASDIVPPGAMATLFSPYDVPDLSAHGWQLVGHPPFMVRLPGAVNELSLPGDIELREVVDRSGLEVFERTLVDGYPMPDLQPYEWGRYYDERVLGGGTRFWIGFVDDEPVATAAAHVAAGVNNVEMVATLEGWRGRGYGAAVTWAATTADPTLPAILIASDPGRPVYERLGYTALTRWTIWLRP